VLVPVDIVMPHAFLRRAGAFSSTVGLDETRLSRSILPASVRVCPSRGLALKGFRHIFKESRFFGIAGLRGLPPVIGGLVE
jgi:hypothetical protein